MRILKKMGNSLLAFAMTANMFVPLTVYANQIITLTFTVKENEEITYSVNNNNELGGTADSQTSFLGFKSHKTDTEFAASDITISCTNNKSCTAVITVPDGDGIDVLLGGDSKFEFEGNMNNITVNQNLIAKLKGNNTQQNNNTQENNQQSGENQEQQVGEQFDGKAVVVWSCGNSICYHVFANLSSNEVNYIKASNVSDDRDETKKFDVHAKEKFFAVKKEFDKRKAEIDANKVSINDLIGPDGIDYQPVNEPVENNALVAYGDRNFKAIIYGEDFKGLSIGSLDDLDYYPSEWNDWFLRRETYDMGGTTRDNPVEIDTILLQKKINLKLLTNLNDYSITKIEALDVPSDAVKITKKNDGSYDFEFASNFYDKVVFKVTTSDKKVQYIYINRRTTDPWIRTDKGKEGIVVETFYDRKKSYKDLDVIAKIVYKDGSSKVVHLAAEKGFEDGLGNIINDYEVDEELGFGKGMKRANFVYSMTSADLKKVDKIYINVEFKGSTTTTFAGNFVGSGKGDVIDMKYWEGRLR